jgi:hypothetical protein
MPELEERWNSGRQSVGKGTGQTRGGAESSKNACYLILRDGNGEVTSPKHSQEECDKLEAGQQYEGGVIEPQPLY